MVLIAFTAGRTMIPRTARSASPWAQLNMIGSMGRTFDLVVRSSKSPGRALPHWLNDSPLRFTNKRKFVGLVPNWNSLTPEFSDKPFGGRGACLVNAEIAKTWEAFK